MWGRVEGDGGAWCRGKGFRRKEKRGVVEVRIVDEGEGFVEERGMVEEWTMEWKMG